MWIDRYLALFRAPSARPAGRLLDFLSQSSVRSVLIEDGRENPPAFPGAVPETVYDAAVANLRRWCQDGCRAASAPIMWEFLNDLWDEAPDPRNSIRSLHIMLERKVSGLEGAMLTVLRSPLDRTVFVDLAARQPDRPPHGTVDRAWYDTTLLAQTWSASGAPLSGALHERLTEAFGTLAAYANSVLPRRSVRSELRRGAFAQAAVRLGHLYKNESGAPKETITLWATARIFGAARRAGKAASPELEAPLRDVLKGCEALKADIAAHNGPAMEGPWQRFEQAAGAWLAASKLTRRWRARAVEAALDRLVEIAYPPPESVDRAVFQ